MLKQLMTLFTILLCSALFSQPTIADHIKDTENKDKADPPITMVQMNKPIGCVPDGKKLTKRINEIKKKYDVESKKIVRANIHLNDWDPGHMIQYERKNDWHDWTKWKTNQGLMFDETSLHIGMNGGTTHKYTLQLSGFLEGS